MSNEIKKDERIEEIKRYIEEYEKRDSGALLQMEIIAYKRVKFLLISLETSQQAREILRKNIEKVQDWGDKIEQENEELKTSLERANEEISELRGEIRVEIENNQEWVADLKKEKEKVSEAEFLRDGMQERVNELFIENEKLKERVGELERKVKNLIATINEDLLEEVKEEK